MMYYHEDYKYIKFVYMISEGTNFMDERINGTYMCI